MSGKKKSGKKRANGSEEEQRKYEEKLLKLRQMEEERQREWTTAWERRLEQEDRDESCKACCAPDKFYRSPRIQSTVWVQVNQDKNAQHVQMTFRDVPVPKPKQPVLRKLRLSDVPDDEPADAGTLGGKNGKSKKGKKKKK